MINLLVALLFSISNYGTFSIVAMDPETNEWGIAVASRVPDVGYIVPWLKADVGGVATQALANPYLGPWILEAMSEGKSAEEALKSALAKDSTPEDRQVGVVDKDGNSAAHTGKGTLEWAGHKTGQYVSVQGNILTGADVVDSRLKAFEETKGPLAERLLAALEAGEKAGGDKRGKQSASLYLVRKRGGYQGVDDRLVDLKVMDNHEPVVELKRLYRMWQYTFLAPAYARLASEEKDKEEIFMSRVYTLLVKALESDLDKPEIYNELAWELALRKKYPKETLEAALMAHDLAPDDPNIMDTVAEAYYAAGKYQKAIYWETEALKRAPNNEFFKKQLAKFKKKGKNGK